MGSRSFDEKEQFLGKGSPIVKYRDFLPWAVQKRLSWSVCCVGCGLEWAKGSTSSIVFARWRHCAHMWGHIGATWRMRFNRLRRRCGLMSNYFDHLLICFVTFYYFFNVFIIHFYVFTSMRCNVPPVKWILGRVSWLKVQNVAEIKRLQ